ncbi:anti-sigma factor family protein [Bounagaea algeriensis]
MSGHDRRGSAPQDPSWSPELLADLHAGALDEGTAQQLRRQIATDPAAREVFAALQVTTEQLGAHEAEPAPDEITARIDGTLRAAAHERQTTRPVALPAAQPAPPRAVPPGPATVRAHGCGSPAADSATAEQPAAGGVPAEGTAARPAPVAELSARRRRRARFAWGASAVAAAAAVAAVLVLALPPWSTTQQARQPPPDRPSPAKPPGSQSTAQQPPAEIPTAPEGSAPIALTGPEVELTGEQFTRVMQQQQYDGLREARQWPGCLQANGAAGAQPLGAHAITLDGQSAQLFVLSTGEIGRFRLLAVRPDCGPDNPATISETTYGG